MAEPAYALPEPDGPEARWPAQGQWTWNDYLRLPDDGQRYEILEGVLYVSPAPSFDHQFTAFKLARLLADFVEAHALGLVVVAPFDVRLPGVADPVEPDLLFFRTGNQPQTGDQYFAGVPDLIAEVLSPGTSRLDQHVKFGVYEKAGIPEYWLVDPKSRSISVYHLDTQRREYDEFGRFGSDETVRSRLLEGFEAAVAALFPPPKA